MKTKEACRILGVTQMTVHNWIKSGKLKLNKVLPNGRYDIREDSVYDAVSSTYEPDSGKNAVVVFRRDGSVVKFRPDDAIADKVMSYLTEMRKLDCDR